MRALSPTSLRAKLATLGACDTLYLPDSVSAGKATIMERAVQTMIRRDPELAARRFVTERMVAVRHHPLCAEAILKVRRVDAAGADAADGE